MGRPWAIAFPAVHFLLFDYVWKQLTTAGSIYWTDGDPIETFLIVSPLILLGTVVRAAVPLRTLVTGSSIEGAHGRTHRRDHRHEGAELE